MFDCTGRRILCVAVPPSTNGHALGSPTDRVDVLTVQAAIETLRTERPFDVVLVHTGAAEAETRDLSDLQAAAQCAPIVFLPSVTPRNADGDASRDSVFGVKPVESLSGPHSELRGAGDALSESYCHRVLVIDDDRFALRLIERALTKAGYDVLTAENGLEGMRKLLNEGAHIVVSDWMMPEMDGLDLCRAIRADESVGFVYFMVLTAQSDKGKLFEAFEAGADDYLTKPCDRGELLLRMRAGSRIVELEGGIAKRSRELHKSNADLAILNNKLKRLAVTDELTGLTNRRAGMEKLKELMGIAQRYDLPFSIIMLDIDHFKSINDTYGHDAGDEVLQTISQELEGVVRNTDVVARFGGEEFLVITPNTDNLQATILAERIRQRVEQKRIKHNGEVLNVTVSLGLGRAINPGTAPVTLLKQADLALYSAKASGRNCWVLADQKLIETSEAATQTG